MIERPPSPSPEIREDTALDALAAASEHALRVEQCIDEALKNADPNKEDDMKHLEGLFAEARDASRRGSEAFSAWKKALAEAKKHAEE